MDWGTLKALPRNKRSAEHALPPPLDAISQAVGLEQWEPLGDPVQFEYQIMDVFNKALFPVNVCYMCACQTLMSFALYPGCVFSKCRPRRE